MRRDPERQRVETASKRNQWRILLRIETGVQRDKRKPKTLKFLEEGEIKKSREDCVRKDQGKAPRSI